MVIQAGRFCLGDVDKGGMKLKPPSGRKAAASRNVLDHTQPIVFRHHPEF